MLAEWNKFEGFILTLLKIYFMDKGNRCIKPLSGMRQYRQPDA